MWLLWRCAEPVAGSKVSKGRLTRDPARQSEAPDTGSEWFNASAGLNSKVPVGTVRKYLK